jgi:hypothetical protein
MKRTVQRLWVFRKSSLGRVVPKKNRVSVAALNLEFRTGSLASVKSIGRKGVVEIAKAGMNWFSGRILSAGRPGGGGVGGRLFLVCHLVGECSGD